MATCPRWAAVRCMWWPNLGLRALGVSKMRLMTNNPKKRTGLVGYGLEIVENVSLEIKSNVHNASYLQVKRDKMGHNLKLDI